MIRLRAHEILNSALPDGHFDFNRNTLYNVGIGIVF